jgi:hypothetical protein
MDEQTIDEQIAGLRAQIAELEQALARDDIDLALAERQLAFDQQVFDEAGAALG